MHQKTNTYTPEQNDMLERMNRIIVEKARCLLFDADLTKLFWAEAVNTAVYLRNRSVVTGLDKTPMEVWLGKKPDISNIRIFGSKVMVHIPKEKRTKWDKKAKQMTLVGFSDHVKGYRLYDPVKKDIIISRDVVIIENVNAKINVSINDTHESTEKISVSVGDDNQQDDQLYDTDRLNYSASSESEYAIPFEIPEGVRRSERQRKAKSYEDYVTCMCSGET